MVYGLLAIGILLVFINAPRVLKYNGLLLSAREKEKELERRVQVESRAQGDALLRQKWEELERLKGEVEECLEQLKREKKNVFSLKVLSAREDMARGVSRVTGDMPGAVDRAYGEPAAVPPGPGPGEGLPGNGWAPRPGGRPAGGRGPGEGSGPYPSPGHRAEVISILKAPGTSNNLRQKVYLLKEKGLEDGEIARDLNLGKGEVEFILGIKRR